MLLHGSSALTMSESTASVAHDLSVAKATDGWSSSPTHEIAVPGTLVSELHKDRVNEGSNINK